MPVVWLLCPDAGLRERLRQCLRDGEGFEVRLKPCACDAVLFAEPMFTPAQVETLRAYVETGSVRGAAQRRCCSEQTVRRHLANARLRVGAQNVAQLVYIACALGVLNAVSSTNWVQKWQNLGIDVGGGQSRIRLEYSQRRRFGGMSRSFVRSAIAAVLSIGILSLGVTMVLSNWSPARSACANLKAVEGAWGQWGSCEGIFTKSCSRIKYPDTCVQAQGTDCVASAPNDPQGQRKSCVYDQNLRQWVCPPGGTPTPYGSQTHYTTISCPYSPGP